MERIDKNYAIIYIDWEGATLTIDTDLNEKKSRRDFDTPELINDYYNSSASLQWNFYLIIPQEVVEVTKDISVKDIENNEIYTRKFVLPKEEIYAFIESRFPDVRPTMGKITLLKGTNYKNCFSLVQHEQLKNKKNNELRADVIGSWYRDESLMLSLTKMDKLRARLILNPALNVIFYTHIDNEFNLAKKKFNYLQNLLINHENENNIPTT